MCVFSGRQLALTYRRGGRYLYSSGSPDDDLTLVFAGTRLDVIYVQHPALGLFVVEVDGLPLQAVDSAAAESAFGVRVSFTLPDGTHTVRVYPQSGTLAIDAFAVEAAIAPPVVPTITPNETDPVPSPTPLPTGTVPP
jgi:hypothetical protein